MSRYEVDHVQSVERRSKLAAAMVIGALDDVYFCKSMDDKPNKDLKVLALDWIMDDDSVYNQRSFLWCCETLNLDVWAIRRMILDDRKGIAVLRVLKKPSGKDKHSRTLVVLGAIRKILKDPAHGSQTSVSGGRK